MPERTCVGCRGKAEKSDLLRVVRAGGRLTPDPRGTAPGRGAYVHPECVEQALRRRAFERALRFPDADPTDLLAAVGVDVPSTIA